MAARGASRDAPTTLPVDPQLRLLVACVVGVASAVALLVAERVNAEWAWPNSVQIGTSAVAVWLSFNLAVAKRRAATALLAAGCLVWWVADLLGMAFGALDLIDDHHRRSGNGPSRSSPR